MARRARRIQKVCSGKPEWIPRRLTWERGERSTPYAPLENNALPEKGKPRQSGAGEARAGNSGAFGGSFDCNEELDGTAQLLNRGDC
jgi:hypothetical protein